MSYHSGQTFVYGETPAASKWQYIWDNDTSFNDGTGIGTGVLNSGHIDWATATGKIWWQELGRTTLGSAGDTITVSGMTARKYLRIYASVLATGGTLNTEIRFNNDSGANYAEKFATDFAGVSSITAATFLNLESSTTSTQAFGTLDVVNILAQEKATFMQANNTGTAGAANVPVGAESIGKWANTSAQITRVDFINIGTGDYAIGSEVIVLGHD